MFDNYYLHEDDKALSLVRICLLIQEKEFVERPQQTYTVAMECEPETVHVFPLPFDWYIFLFWYSFTCQTNLKCIENCTITVAILEGVQTNSSVQADPDQHAPNSAYFDIRGWSNHSSIWVSNQHFKLINSVLLSLDLKYFMVNFKARTRTQGSSWLEQKSG